MVWIAGTARAAIAQQRRIARTTEHFHVRTITCSRKGRTTHVRSPEICGARARVGHAAHGAFGVREAADGDRRLFRPGAFRGRGSGADPISDPTPGCRGRGSCSAPTRSSLVRTFIVLLVRLHLPERARGPLLRTPMIRDLAVARHPLRDRMTAAPVLLWPRCRTGVSLAGEHNPRVRARREDAREAWRDRPVLVVHDRFAIPGRHAVGRHPGPVRNPGAV